MTSNRRTFLKQLGFGMGGLGFAFTLPPSVFAHGSSAARLPRSAPEAEGVSSAGILAFLDAIARSKHEFHSFMMMRHGRVVAEGWWSPYGQDLVHTLYSMSKSFTSTAVALAVTDGKLRVDDKVVSFFPKDLPDAISEYLAALRVRDLLTMSVGHEKEPSGAMVKEENWAKAFLAWPIPNAPGSHFLYNSAASYMLSAIVQKVTGKTALENLKPRVFEPLGIEGATWETCPRGINTGGWGLSVRTEDLAKFGQLYLQKGSWNGREILPAKWVEEATTFKIQQPEPAKPTRPDAQNDWLQGYCYQFWRCQHHAFRGDGAFGQFTIVFPEQDAVVAITSESPSMQGELDLVWEHLLPAMSANPLPEDPATQWRLAQTLSSLALTPPKGQAASPEADRISGKTFKIEGSGSGIQSATFEFRDAACLFTLKDAHAEYPIRCGIEKWQLCETALPGTPPRIIAGGAPKPGTLAKVAASATWKPDASEPGAADYFGNDVALLRNTAPRHRHLPFRWGRGGDRLHEQYRAEGRETEGSAPDPAREACLKKRRICRAELWKSFSTRRLARDAGFLQIFESFRASTVESFKEVSEIMNFPKYCGLALAAALALGSCQQADAHGGSGGSGGSGHGGGSHGFARGFHGSSGFHSSASYRGRNPTIVRTPGSDGTPTFGVIGGQADFPARVAGQNSTNRLTRPTSGWNTNWDRVWHGRHYHWNNGAWAIINDGDYPWDDSYYFPSSPDVYPDMSYEYNDTTPAVAPVAPPGAAVPTNGAGSAPDTMATTAVAPKPSSIATAVQRGLAARGYYNGQINGVVGKSTRAAISDFQADSEIPATGSITQSLLQALGL